MRVCKLELGGNKGAFQETPSVEWLAVFAASTSNNQNRRKQLLSTWVEDHQLIYISSSFTEDSLVSPFLCAPRLQTMRVDDTN